MKPQHFYDELTYQLTMSQAKVLLTNGVIDEPAFLCFKDRMKEKFHPIISQYDGLIT
ncbi:SHOCT domain-containing protein [Streptococcus suis]|uniref:SHOCT domain-containing protein n=1 Tax=Streptococcus suis TaxID=1307 RepID=UPI0018644095|nr:SHOCT domain-containing protein [Streptococcus suis]